jgi:recombination protein RecT
MATHNAMAVIGDKSNSIGVRIRSVGDVMEANKDTMFAALATHITPERFMRVAMNCIRSTPKLLDCTPASLFGAITEAATLGLEPNGILGHAYLIPYGKECVLVPGYKGLIDLARRSGTISTLTMEVVHKGDEFEYGLGDTPYVKHHPNDDDPDRDTKPVTHVYAIVVLMNGGIQRKVWSTPKIDAHKQRYSKAWKKADSPWQTAWPIMAKKTVIRDMIGRGEIPVSVECQNLASRDEYGDMVVESTATPAATVRTLDDLTDDLIGTTPEPDAEPEAPADDREAWRQGMYADFESADSITQVTTIETLCANEAENESDKQQVEMNAAAARQRIKDSRGEKSNGGDLLD